MDGQICLTNNAAERALSRFALGRKSWLFAGHDRGAVRAAALARLIATASSTTSIRKIGLPTVCVLSGWAVRLANCDVRGAFLRPVPLFDGGKEARDVGLADEPRLRPVAVVNFDQLVLLRGKLQLQPPLALSRTLSIGTALAAALCRRSISTSRSSGRSSHSFSHSCEPICAEGDFKKIRNLGIIYPEICGARTITQIPK